MDEIVLANMGLTRVPDEAVRLGAETTVLNVEVRAPLGGHATRGPLSPRLFFVDGLPVGQRHRRAAGHAPHRRRDAAVA